jgi:hypothetical protein
MVTFVGSHTEGKPLRLWQVRHIVVHRLSLAGIGIPDEELTGKQIIESFRDPNLGTGGRPPYHAAILQDTTIEQMLPLAVTGSHAINYNWCSWGVCVIGNTTLRPPRPGQVESLIAACRVLACANGGLSIEGHTDLPGASGDPNKVCPGHLMPLDVVRSNALTCVSALSWPEDAQAFGFEL